MISINPAAFNSLAASKNTGAKNSQIQMLEKKLQQLNKEKKEAQQKQDKDKVRELEKEIQATQQKLEQLKEKENQKQKQEEQQRKHQASSNQAPAFGISNQNSVLGIYLDELA